MQRSSLTKEAIATRMFRNAARQWGHNETNIDNFDPLVRLLIEACAVEMYKLDNQIESVQERMVEKLANMLTPQVYVQPKPAHAIIHGRATDAEGSVSRNMQFFFNKKVASRPNGPIDSNIDLFFSPTGNYKVIDADVKVIASGNNIYKVNEWQEKELVMRTQGNRTLPGRTVWVGIDMNSGVADLANLSLFFNLKNTPGAAKYHDLIPYLNCSVNDTIIHLHKGVVDQTEMTQERSFQNSLDELYLNNRIENFTSAYYKNQFATISEQNSFLRKLNANVKRKYPAEFESILGASELSQFSKDMLWLKIYFRPEFSAEVLDDLTVSINCFPVVNRKQNEITYRLQSFFNIIPLLSQEQLISVNKVESTSAKAKGDAEYKFFTFDQFDKERKGTYTLRNGDLERFSNRNAQEYLEYLVELLRDESRTFAAFGQDFVASTIKELNQNITQIEQRIRLNSSVTNTLAYLLINPIEENDTVFVNFWTCNGEQANDIRSGTRLDLYEGAEVKKDTLLLMTSTTGGANKLKNTETLAAYKHVLISRGRIVTQEDVRSFCQYFLQNKAMTTAIEVTKGVGISNKPSEGLVPTVDISIKPSKNDVLGLEEWATLKHELLVNLEEQSAVNFNYRVFVNQIK